MDHPVKPAERGDGIGKGTLHLRPLRNVAGMEADRARIALVRRGGSGFAGLCRDVERGDLCPRPGQGDDDSAAHAHAATGHDDPLAFYAHSITLL